MSDQNGSLTRVQAIFTQLLDQWPDGHPWLGACWDMAAQTRAGAALPTPAHLGTLVASETPRDRTARMGTVFERTVAPPAAFLRWLLENPQNMQVRDPATFSAKSDDARKWRGKLFSGDLALVRDAQAEGLKQLGSRLAQRGRNKWWAFEGFSRVDGCFVTDQCVLFVEGTRTDAVSPSTWWFPQRSRLWRTVEAAREFAGSKPFAVMLAVESEVDGATALAAATASLDASYPHLSPEQRVELSRHLIGFVTCPALVSRFGLPPIYSISNDR